MKHMSASIIATLLVIAIFFLLAWFDREPGASKPGFFQRNGAALSLYLIIAVGLWVVFTITLPMLFMVDLSFHHKLAPSQIGGPRDTYTLTNYRMFLFGSTTDTQHWNTLHLHSFLVTIGASLLLTLVTFALCYPIAYHMAQSATPSRLRTLLLLLIIPYWVNDILRAFAFRIAFSENGFINHLLMSFGWVDAPVDFLNQNTALYLALCYSHLLIMIFPLYNALEAQDHNQIEAARDLGAPWWHIHLHIVIPQAKPGIASGMTLCFMLTAGAVATPLVLGGTRSLWFTPIVYDRFYQLFDWPQGAAYALVLLFACIIFVLGVLKVSGLKLGEIAK